MSNYNQGKKAPPGRSLKNEFASQQNEVPIANIPSLPPRMLSPPNSATSETFSDRTRGLGVQTYSQSPSPVKFGISPVPNDSPIKNNHLSGTLKFQQHFPGNYSNGDFSNYSEVTEHATSQIPQHNMSQKQMPHHHQYRERPQQQQQQHSKQQQHLYNHNEQNLQNHQQLQPPSHTSQSLDSNFQRQQFRSAPNGHAAPPFKQTQPHSTHPYSSHVPLPAPQNQNMIQMRQPHIPPPQQHAVKQRSGSEYIRRPDDRSSPKRSPSLPQAQYMNQKGLTAAQRSPTAPVSGSTKPSLSLNSSQISPSQNSSKKSPIVRQSLSFLRNARNFSSSSLSLSNNQDYVQPGIANGSANGGQKNGTMDKYHLPNKQSIGGRIIPQRDNDSVNVQRRNKSFGSLTRRVASSASLRSSGDKTKFMTSSSGTVSRTISQSASVRQINVNPALLSQAAKGFKNIIILQDHYKNGIMYRDSFTGSEAVDVLCKIARTSDRNLGIILGRALDSQRFFHDVTYEHRLRDNTHEIYKFNEDSEYSDTTEIYRRQNSVASALTDIVDEYSNFNYSSEFHSINGVFVYLTGCYSPTCTRDKVCYSISCPRRLEQQMRAETKVSSISRSDSHIAFDSDQKQYWQLTVPKNLLESLEKNEIKRQEGIFEVVSSEKAFVKDLEYIREFWIRPLSETKIIKDKEREHFIRSVFHNINEIWSINHKFAESLIRRQQLSPIVTGIADIFLEFIPQFTSFETYGAGQVVGKYEFDRQRKINPLLRRFVEDTSKRAESKRLDLSSFLSKPTTRPARYPLLLKTIRDHTDKESDEYEKLGTCIDLLENMLKTINFETGKQADKMHLFQLKQKLLFKPGELVDLKLNADQRKLIYQCVLKKKGYQEKENQGEIHAYLFDHCLLFIKIGYMNKKEVFKVYQRPIPLPLLYYSLNEFPPSMRQIRNQSSKSGIPLIGESSSSVPLNSPASKCPITFKYIGEHGYDITLYATSAAQKMLSTKIEQQAKKIINDNDVYTLTMLNSQSFHRENKINCVVPFDGGRKLMFGTDSGIYISDRSNTNVGENNSASKPVKVIGKVNVIKADIMEEYQILLVLSDKKLMYWPLETLRGGDPQKNAKLGKELMNHVSFFKVGVCDGRMLVCAAKSSGNIVRIFEPCDPVTQKKSKKKFTNMRDDLHFASEPVSISFLKTKLCVGCSRGFQIVSLTSGTMEELLDPADTSLEFATGKEGLKPLEIDRINSDFLLSYSTFSFFINHNGWRVKPRWMIQWEGVPHAFALWYPYILAFDSNFIEIRNVLNAELLRVIVADNIRFLHSSSQEILYVYEDERGYDIVASLDFWDKSMKNRSRAGTLIQN
ncbi:Rho family guanine nucleotide exchange factor [Martiniozyma asiatica (nom. inval.)]|nr:Rho family guanine nucleotide exchange factor [Martiniozyma asiatica]